MMNITALTTCNNRRDRTLVALGGLHNQELPAGVTLRVVVVDDGSTDGTSEAIHNAFPDVAIHSGTGDLYWAGGMRLGYEQLQGDAYDALLVFNDDIELEQDAVKRLIETSDELCARGITRHGVCGSLATRGDGAVTYGAYRCVSAWFPLRHERVAPSLIAEPVDTFNMNLALIRREALETVGFLADYFQHSEADIEFCHRLRRAGGECWLAPGIQGYCERNPVQGTYYEPGISRLERLRRYNSIKAWPFRQRLRYCMAYGGWLWPVTWLAPYIRIFVFNHIERR